MLFQPLIGLLARHPDWALGFEDETWWSRLARPNLFAWAPNDKPLRIIEQSVAKDDPDPKALAAYGILLRLVQSDSSIPDSSIKEEVWLRFVDGQPISSVTTQFLDWVCKRLEALGKTALLMPWDNAPWHVSREVRTWVRDHNQRVKREKRGVRTDEGSPSSNYRLLLADQESLAQPVDGSALPSDRTLLGSCQAQGG